MIADPLDSWARSLATLPIRHPRRIGMHLLQAGALISISSLPFSMAGMNSGLVVAGLGALLSRLPFHTLTGFRLGMVFCAWLMFSRVVVGLPGGQAVFDSTGPFYSWTQLLLVQGAFYRGLPGALRLRTVTVRIMIAAMVLSALLAAIQFTVGFGGGGPWRVQTDGLHGQRSSGFFSIHLTQGAVQALLALAVLGLGAWAGTVWVRIGVVAAATSVMICGARSALLGFIAGAGAGIASRGRKHLLWGIGLAVLMFALGASVFAWTNPQRFSDAVHLQDGRWAIWRTSLHIFQEHPWLGTGGPTPFRAAYLEAFPLVEGPQAWNEFPKGAPHAHHTLLSFATQYGLLAPLLHLTLLFGVVWALRGRPQFRPALAMATTVVVFGQFEYIDASTSHVLWSSLGLLVAAARDPDPSTLT
jgi:hypothetical protein